MRSKRPIRVMIADDHPVMREGLRALIGRRRDMAVVAEASTGPQALVEATRCQPDVALVDMHMPGMTGSQLLTALEREAPGTRVVVFSAYSRKEEVTAALRAGAKAYIRKEAPREELFACIRTVHAADPHPVPAADRKRITRDGR